MKHFAAATLLSLFTMSAVADTTTALVRADAETSVSRRDYRTTVTFDRGCIVRGPRAEKRIALVFTGGDYANGGATVLDTLERRKVRAGFFFTGDFLRRAEFAPLVQRIVRDGHYLGPHSDKHLQYASWDTTPTLLVTREQFDEDLTSNTNLLKALGVPVPRSRLFLPPFEHWTPEISEWTTARGMKLICFSRGTRSHTDYMEDDDPKFLPATEIMKSILDREISDPDGLNGFVLLLHFGASPRRTRDNTWELLDGLLAELTNRGYRFERVDELLDPSSH